MIAVEAGTNWEICRGIINPDLACLAGYQALKLANCQTAFSEVERKEQGLTACYVRMFQPREGGPSDTMRVDKSAMKKFAALVWVHEEIREQLGLDYDPGMIINILAGGASMRGHVDRNINGRTTSVKLLGEKDAVTLRDSVTGVEHPFGLNMGDGMRLNNGKTDNKDLRPFHGVENQGSGLRVSLTVASAA